MIILSAIRYAPHALVAVLAIAALSIAVDWGRRVERDRVEPRLLSLQAEINYARARAQAEEIARRRVETTLESYHAEILQIRSRPTLAAPVRLCRAPAARSLPGSAQGADGPAAPSRSDSEGAGGDSGEGPGPDIGPDLAALAASCEVVSARLRALQQWVQPAD